MKHLCLVVLSMMLLISNGVCADVLDVKGCVRLALENNPSLAAARAGVDAAEMHVKTMRADFMPSLSTGYSQSTIISQSAKGATDADYLDQDVRSFNLKLTQILYAGSRIVNEYQKAKLRTQVAEAGMYLEQSELVYHVETTFYKMMKARQDVLTANETIASLTEHIKAAESFFKRELVPWVDVLQARVDLADAQEQQHIAKNNVRREKTTLYALMGMPMDPLQAFADPEYKVPDTLPAYEESYTVAIATRPDIQSLKAQLEIAKKDARIALGGYAPVIKFEGGYYDLDKDYDKATIYTRDQRNRYWSAGLYASWDLFDGGRSWYKIKEAEAQAAKMTALLSDADQLISTSIRKALFSMTDARQRIASAKEALAAAREFVANQERRLMAGVSTVPNLLTAQERKVRAQGNLARAILDFQLAGSELKLMTGKAEIDEKSRG